MSIQNDGQEMYQRPARSEHDETITIHGPITAASRKRIGEIIQAAEHQGRELLAQGQDPSMFTGRQPDDHLTHLRLAQEQVEREVRIGARDMAGAYVARQAQDGPSGAMLGQALGGGIAFQLGAPGKMFSRETICAIVRGQIAITHDSHLKDLLTIFERME